MKMKHLAALVAVGLIAGIFVTTNPLGDKTPENVEGSESIQTVSEKYNFQGETENLQVTDGGLELDTNTVTTEEELTGGRIVAGVNDGAVYITKEDGNTVAYQDGEEEELNFNSAYGSVTGDFDYSGFNVIYADSDKEAYIRNVETGEEEKLFEDVVEIVKADNNGDGTPESAEIRLRNGSQIIKEPAGSGEVKEDWNNDGYEQRLYIKNNALYSYDRQNGEEKVTDANSFAYEDGAVYTAYEGTVSRLNFEQEYVSEGTYVSQPIEFNETVEFTQLITRAELNGGSIEAELTTPLENQTFSIEDGFKDKQFSVRSEEAKLKFTLETSDKQRTPLLEEYELRTK